MVSLKQNFSSPLFRAARLATRPVRRSLCTHSQRSMTNLKTETREQWNKLSAGYSKFVIEAQLMRGLPDKFADVFAASYGNAGPIQVLDVAASNGEPAITIAKALPHARVISTDLAEDFIALGQARAAAAGVTDRVVFEAADAEELSQFGDASMDAVTCSIGLMLVGDWRRALSEFFRVLKPGGLLAVTVWHSLARVPFMLALREFCQELDPAATVPASVPACKFGDTAEELLQGLHEAGFQQVSREDLIVEFALPAGQWWEAMQEMPFPVRAALAKVKQEGGKPALEAAHAKLERFFDAKGFLQPDGAFSSEGNWCHFITARK